MEKILWRAMLESDFNGRYWKCMVEKFSRRDYALRIFLAISASGTVAGWGLWSEFPLLWKLLSAAAAIASIASPVLGYGKKLEASAAHAGLWADLRIRYSDLWERFKSNGSMENMERENMRLRKIFAELEAREPRLKLSEDKRLAKRCQHEVLRSRGLI